MSTDTPSYFSFDLQTKYLEDETDFLQLGDSVKRYFTSPNQRQKTDFQIQKSGWRNFPNKYKFFSTHITIGSDVLKIRRKTDSFLDWLGDWGGLLDSLYFICDILVSPYAAYILRSKLALLLVNFVPSRKSKGICKQEIFASEYLDQHDDPKRRNIL